MASESSGEDSEEESCNINRVSLIDGEIDTKMEVNDLDNQEQVKRWLDRCRAHSSVICTEYEVPYGILPKGYNGVLIDVKVGGRKRVPDDKIYLQHEELRAKVARGNCVLELNRIEKGRIADTTYFFLIFALKKFSGGLGDEDDSSYAQSQWIHFFVKGIDKTRKVIGTTKENGEAAHITSRTIFGQSYFCIGSKNVHMLIRNSDDISKYKDGRFEFARRISSAFFRTVIDNPEIQEEKKDALKAFMQNNHYTAVAEVLQPDHQHVVNLSHLQHSELRFICWTKPDLAEDFKSNTLCSLRIDHAIDKAREFGLQTIKYEVIEIDQDPVSEIEQYMAKIREEHGYEGKVLYFVDSDGNTFGIIKKKTAWYILLRALRERVAASLSSRASQTISEKRASIVKRFKAIQIWLGFSNQYAEIWTELGCGFLDFVHSNPPDKINFRSMFPVIFENYLKQNGDQKMKYEKLLGHFDASVESLL